MRVGFEPTVRINPHFGFQNRPVRPLQHLTWAVGVGVEPTLGFRLAGLANPSRDRLSHPPCVNILLLCDPTMSKYFLVRLQLYSQTYLVSNLSAILAPRPNLLRCS